MVEFQRSRLLRAAVEEAARSGYSSTPVAAIIARARVSRKTFYELFDSRDSCFLAVFEECLAQVASVVAPAYEAEGRWSERMRGAVAALLGFLESEREVGAFTLSCMVGYSPVGPERRVRVLEQLEGALEEGRSQAKSGPASSPLTAELVVGGALSLIHTRTHAGQRDLSALVNPLMWMIVLPYLGPAAAAREMRRTPPEPVVRPSKRETGPLEGLDMRVTYRTARVLMAIAEAPGRSNTEISESADITDQGQISKLLGRLAHLGLIENTGGGQSKGLANAWQLTPRGEEVDAAIRREFATTGHLRRRR